MAKLVKVLGANVARPESYITGTSNIENYGVPLISIPTTSGTGSESTSFAVVYIKKVKSSL